MMLLIFYVLAFCIVVWFILNAVCTYLDGNMWLLLFYCVMGFFVFIWIAWVTVEVLT